MKKLLFVSLFVGAVGALFAQSQPEKYVAEITPASLKTQLTVIAGPEMEGRETATPGQRKAAAYIADQFKQAGLLPAPGTSNYLQEYPLYYDTVLQTTLKVGKKTFGFGRDFLTTAALGGAKAKQVVFAGYGINDSLYNDYVGKDVKGKIVLIFSGEPRRDTLFLINGTKRPGRWSSVATKAAEAKKQGATGVLLVSATVAGFRPDTSLSARRTDIYYPRPAGANNQSVSVVNISNEVAAEIFGTEPFNTLLAKAKSFQQLSDQQLTAKKKIDFAFAGRQMLSPSTNVAGYIEGTDKKDEFVVLTAHYDHLGKRGELVFNGADDDGSGTVSVIEMARAFAKAKADGNGPRRSIVFMTVSGEEKGLLGSQYYGDHPLFPLDKTSANLNTDMVGRIDPSRKEGDSTNYVYIIGDDRLSTDLSKITDEVNSKYVNLELDRRFNANDPNRFYFRSDHYNLAKKGVPIIFYFNGTHADYHRATDTIDKINFDVMNKRVHLVFHTAWAMANRDEMLKRDIPLR